MLAVTVPAPTAGAAPPPGTEPTAERPQLVDVPVGCSYEQFDNTLVVFVGTVVDDDYRTIRYRVDQVRAGDMNLYASQVGADVPGYSGQASSETLVDVRYAIDTKYLEIGSQYLVGARYNDAQGVLVSRVSERPAAIGDDEIIGSSESELDCPDVDNPVMTLRTDGRPVDSGLFKPFTDERPQLLGALLIPFAVACGLIFLLAFIKWTITGLGASSAAARERRRQRNTRRPPPGNRSPRPAMSGSGGRTAERGRKP